MIPQPSLDAMSWTFMFVSFGILWYILRDISRRLGEALRMHRKYYELYDLGFIILVAAYIGGFLEFFTNVSWYVAGFDLVYVADRLVELAGAIVLLIVTVKYWGWIVPEVLARRKK